MVRTNGHGWQMVRVAGLVLWTPSRETPVRQKEPEQEQHNKEMERPARGGGSRRRGVLLPERPDGIDAVILLPPDFEHQIEEGVEAALELEEMLLTRRPEEIFAAEDETDWEDWIEFFSRTREADGRRKGLVEIEL